MTRQRQSSLRRRRISADDARFGPRRPVRRVRGAQYPDLDAYLKATGETQASVAAHVKTTQVYISRVRRGLLVPHPELAARIARYAGLPLDSFMKVWLRRQSALKRSA